MGDNSSGSKGPFDVSGSTGTGLSAFDVNSLKTAMGQNVDALKARYKQLGLGDSTMQQQDVAGEKSREQAGLGQLFNQNVSNQGIPGSFANVAANDAQQALANSQFGQGLSDIIKQFTG